MVSLVLALLAQSVTGITTMIGQPASAQAGPSGCPDPGQCTCNPASGVMIDHAMSPPIPINNGCTEPGRVP